MNKLDAILLVGPTGSGKTPLGNLMEKRGFRGRQCIHFDFGKLLRKIANAPKPSYLAKSEYHIVKAVLKTNALLEDHQFQIAQKILDAFIAEQVKDSDFILLNGLPRHQSQAEDLESIVHVIFLIHLFASPEVVKERIRLDAGGDRKNRKDDSLKEIRRKLNIFRKRTLPLLAFYRDKNIPVLSVPVSADTSAETLLSIIDNEKRV